MKEGKYMNEQLVNSLKLFIKLYEKAQDKEAFINMWKTFLYATNEPFTLEDGYNEAYGNSIAQIMALEEE